MTAIGRIVVLVLITAGVIGGANVPAWAAFGDTVKLTTTITSITVAAPATVTVNDSCTTSTTVERWTVYTDPSTGVQTQTAYSSTTTYATSASNVQSTATSSVAGPGLNEVTTTTTTKNTMLSVPASWPASASRGVSGYLVNAHLSDGTTYPMTQTPAGTLSTSQTVDADNLAYQPRLSVTTLTSYGWTAESAKSAVLAC